MSWLTSEVLSVGRTDSRSEPIGLCAGPLTLVFESDRASLRSLRLGSREVLRGIYGAVRDPNWGTVAPQVSELELHSQPASFGVQFVARCRRDDIDFEWRGSIVGEAVGKITFVFEGLAHSSFRRSRIGLCVLHPIRECAGQPCVVAHTDGTLESGVFPEFIAPHQPFKRLRAITHEVVPGVRAEVRCEGEVFEMEDQRNWTDASYKIYGTPLELPFPVLIEKGTRLQQSVTLVLHCQTPFEVGRTVPSAPPAVQGSPSSASAKGTPPGLVSNREDSLLSHLQHKTVGPEEPARVTVRMWEAPFRNKPPIGLGLASHGRPLPPREIECLKALGLTHLRMDLRFEDRDWAVKLQLATREATQLGVGLHGALFLSLEAPRELAALRDQVERLQPNILLWIVFQIGAPTVPESLMRLAQSTLSVATPAALFAGGTNANFAELNRHRPAPDSPWLSCFSINPQVHAFDETTLVENLEAQAMAIETARQFTRQPIVVSPITLRPRFNAVATSAESESAGRALPPSVDPRQMSLFGAGWTLGSLAQLAVLDSVHSLTYYETTGWRGVMETVDGSPMPKEFPSEPGMVFPIYHVLADLAESCQIAPVVVSDPHRITGLASQTRDGQHRLLLANVAGHSQSVRLETGAAHGSIRLLDAANAEEALLSPERFRARLGQALECRHGIVEMELPPYALARIDLT